MDSNVFSLVRDLASAETVSVRVRGTCMVPHVADGAMLAVRARPAFPGDVVVFRTPAGDLAAHRLLGWRRAGLVTKGDHAFVHDAPVRRDAVIGIARIAVHPADRLRALRSYVRIAWRRLLR